MVSAKVSVRFAVRHCLEFFTEINKISEFLQKIIPCINQINGLKHLSKQKNYRRIKNADTCQQY